MEATPLSIVLGLVIPALGLVLVSQASFKASRVWFIDHRRRRNYIVQVAAGAAWVLFGLTWPWFGVAL